MFKFLIPAGIIVSIATADMFPLLIVLLMFFCYKLGVREVIAQIESLYAEEDICDRIQGCDDCDNCILNKIEDIVKRGGRKNANDKR